jgi:hypothetical protein
MVGQPLFGAPVSGATRPFRFSCAVRHGAKIRDRRTVPYSGQWLSRLAAEAAFFPRSIARKDIAIAALSTGPALAALTLHYRA